MTQILKAVFDGKVFRPEEPVNLKPDSHVQILVTAPDETKSSREGRSLLRAVAAMNLEGPRDWSENFEEYLYRGKPLEIEHVYPAPANLVVATRRRARTKGTKQ